MARHASRVPPLYIRRGRGSTERTCPPSAWMLERCIDRVLGRTYTVTNAPPEAVPASGGGFSLASNQALREDSYGDRPEELC